MSELSVQHSRLLGFSREEAEEIYALTVELIDSYRIRKHPAYGPLSGDYSQQ